VAGRGKLSSEDEGEIEFCVRECLFVLCVLCVLYVCVICVMCVICLCYMCYVSYMFVLYVLCQLYVCVICLTDVIVRPITYYNSNQQMHTNLYNIIKQQLLHISGLIRQSSGTNSYVNQEAKQVYHFRNLQLFYKISQNI